LVQRLIASWTIEVSDFECRKSKKYSALHVVRTGSGHSPAFYVLNTVALSQGLKLPGQYTDHSPPNPAEVKKTFCTSIFPYVFFMA
jgi:hypothetical protein